MRNCTGLVFENCTTERVLSWFVVPARLEYYATTTHSELVGVRVLEQVTAVGMSNVFSVDLFHESIERHLHEDTDALHKSGAVFILRIVENVSRAACQIVEVTIGHE